MDLAAIQEALVKENVDGWLFFDFANRDAITYRILGLPQKHTSRRFYYLVPAKGEPTKLVHRVEPGKLDILPGRKLDYSSWREMRSSLGEALSGLKRVAMQYSPGCDIPYISVVDAGTVELIRSFGVEVVCSANLVQTFEGLVDTKTYETHVEAGRRICEVLDGAWKEMGRCIAEHRTTNEFEIQQFILDGFRRNELSWDDAPPIVAVNEHAADPHFEVTQEKAFTIKPGVRLLIDLWARLDKPVGVYYDITWCAYVGGPPDRRYKEVFDLAVRARDRALAFVGERLGSNEPLSGQEIDDACREVIEKAGLGRFFVHRTGHSIGRDVHGNGANIDNLETADHRGIVPGSLFSIEPGIYLPDEKLGVRTEIDVYIDPNNKPLVYGPLQKDLVQIG